MIHVVTREEFIEQVLRDGRASVDLNTVDFQVADLETAFSVVVHGVLDGAVLTLTVEDNGTVV